MTFVVELDNYQGPFDVFLDLLRRRRLEITEVAISSITNDYLDYINNSNLNLDEISDFLAVATKLALDKSSAILFIVPEREEPDLEESLKRYAQIKSLAEQLKDLLKKPFLSSEKQYQVNITTKPIDSNSLANMYYDLLKTYSARPAQRLIKTQQKQLEKIRSEFMADISSLRQLDLNDIVKSKDKTETIVRLLTILDLLKQGRLMQVNNHYQLMGATS